jgi:chromosome segregation ATPase
MIIGPNGTGKSTIVSAIALGLGYHPKELGRAREIKEFVKREEGIQDGWVELELKRIGQRNPTIRRAMNRRDNKSIFYLNGPFLVYRARTART